MVVITTKYYHDYCCYYCSYYCCYYHYYYQLLLSIIVIIINYYCYYYYHDYWVITIVVRVIIIIIIIIQTNKMEVIEALSLSLSISPSKNPMSPLPSAFSALLSLSSKSNFNFLRSSVTPPVARRNCQAPELLHGWFLGLEPPAFESFGFDGWAPPGLASW